MNHSIFFAQRNDQYLPLETLSCIIMSHTLFYKGLCSFYNIFSNMKTMFFPLIVNLFIFTIISSVNSLCSQSGCTLLEAGSTCCFNIGCCRASKNVCCPNDITNCCSTQYPVCCGAGKGCCPQRYPVCCSAHCCMSGSYCCGNKCCRRDGSTGRFIEIIDGLSKMNQYKTMMMNIYHP